MLRALKFISHVNTNRGNDISHTFQCASLHATLCHGRCYEIMKSLGYDYKTLSLSCNINSNSKANTTTFKSTSTRHETPLCFASMRNKNDVLCNY